VRQLYQKSSNTSILSPVLVGSGFSIVVKSIPSSAAQTGPANNTLNRAAAMDLAFIRLSNLVLQHTECWIDYLRQRSQYGSDTQILMA